MHPIAHIIITFILMKVLIIDSIGMEDVQTQPDAHDHSVKTPEVLFDLDHTYDHEFMYHDGLDQGTNVHIIVGEGDHHDNDDIKSDIYVKIDVKYLIWYMLTIHIMVIIATTIDALNERFEFLVDRGYIILTMIQNIVCTFFYF